MRVSTRFLAIAIAALMLAFGAGSPSDAAPSTLLLKADQNAKAVVDVRYRRRAVQLYLPIAPNYSAYDYPYYFARGYYPTHIGPGYIYYGRPYGYYGRPYAYYARPYRHRVYVRRGARASRF